MTGIFFKYALLSLALWNNNATAQAPAGTAPVPAGGARSPGTGTAQAPAGGSSSTAKPTSSAQPSPPPAKGPQERQFLSVPPRSLAAMRLHRASFPDEASLRCSLLEPCVMGLTRGFAVASDLAGTAQSVIIQNQIRAGRWLSADGAVGFQFLEGVDKTFWANGSLGWRRMLYEDSNNNEVKISGFTGSIDFAQEISGFYTQGLHFESMFSRDNSLSTGDRIYENSNRGAHARRAVNSLFEYSHRRPTFWLSLPADAELLNWKASHIDLPSDIRGYVHAEPFFAQNELVLDDGFSWVEQDFGLRTGVVGAYESDRDRVSGRFALKGHAGVELAFTREKHKTERAESGVVFELPQRAAVSAYLDLSASWQF